VFDEGEALLEATSGLGLEGALADAGAAVGRRA